MEIIAHPTFYQKALFRSKAYIVTIKEININFEKYHHNIAWSAFY